MNITLAVDFEEFCQWRLAQQVDRLVDEHLCSGRSVSKTAAALRDEQERLAALSEAFYKATELMDAEAAKEAESRNQRFTEAMNDIAAAFSTSPDLVAQSAADEPQDIPGPPTPAPAETKIVRIHWRDACSIPGWHFAREIEEQGLSLVESVGWLVGEDDSCVKLATSVSDGVAGNVTIIPKSGIVDRWEFKGE